MWVCCVASATGVVTAARRRVAAAEAALAKEQQAFTTAEAALAGARAAAAAAAAGAAGAAEAGEGEEEAENSGVAWPRDTVLWSAAVRCVPGRRCWAKYGLDDEELWFRATVTAVHRNDVGQWADVRYDDGDAETMKPIKRVRAVDDSESESDDD